MKLLADANIEPQLVARLHADGHTIQSVREYDAGAADELVLAMARKYSSVLLTYDLDFGELVVREGLLNSGVIILRLDPLSLKARIERAAQALKNLPPPPAGVLCVIEPADFREHEAPEGHGT